MSKTVEVAKSGGETAKIGWNNLPDMPLSIMLSKSGLSDIGQDIIFDGSI